MSTNKLLRLFILPLLFIVFRYTVRLFLKVYYNIHKTYFCKQVNNFCFIFLFFFSRVFNFLFIDSLCLPHHTFCSHSFLHPFVTALTKKRKEKKFKTKKRRKRKHLIIEAAVCTVSHTVNPLRYTFTCKCLLEKRHWSASIPLVSATLSKLGPRWDSSLITTCCPVLWIS